MDTLFLPQTIRKHTSNWHAFRTRSLPGTRNFQFSGFFYIGKTSDHIHKLVQMYTSGYAAEGLVIAKDELLRVLGREENILPEVIMCEACYGFDEIRKFSNFLRNHPLLHSIPFILDVSGLTTEQIGEYRRNTRPDEILFLNRCDEHALNSKVRFLRKMKATHQRSIPPQIEENRHEDHPLSIGFGSKRMFDILIASLFLLVLSPIFLLIALAIFVESRGPVFYVAKRAGRGYRIFNFYKFRTMCLGADKKVSDLTHMNQYNAGDGPVFFKVSNDPRVTRVGKILRNTSLDELPQLLNVLLGDMSLVGNRPLPLYEAARLTTDDYAARFMAPAGITGLWQVKKRGAKDMSVQERISIDIDYAAKCSFATDLWIIVNTPSALLQKENV